MKLEVLFVDLCALCQPPTPPLPSPTRFQGLGHRLVVLSPSAAETRYQERALSFTFIESSQVRLFTASIYRSLAEPTSTENQIFSRHYRLMASTQTNASYWELFVRTAFCVEEWKGKKKTPQSWRWSCSYLVKWFSPSIRYISVQWNAYSQLWLPPKGNLVKAFYSWGVRPSEKLQGH